MHKVKLNMDELTVDSFDLGSDGRALKAITTINSGSCTPAGSCFDGCYTASDARPRCY